MCLATESEYIVLICLAKVAADFQFSLGYYIIFFPWSICYHRCFLVAKGQYFQCSILTVRALFEMQTLELRMLDVTVDL